MLSLPSSTNIINAKSICTMLTRTQLSQTLSRRRKRGSLTVLPTDVFYSGLTDAAFPPAEPGDVIIMPTVLSRTVTTDYGMQFQEAASPMIYEALDVASQYYKAFHFGVNFKATAGKVRTIASTLRNDLDAVIDPVHPGLMEQGDFNAHMQSQLVKELTTLSVLERFTLLPLVEPVPQPTRDMGIQLFVMLVNQTEGSQFDPNMARRDVVQVGRSTPGGSLVTRPTVFPYLQVLQELWMGAFEPLVRAYFPRSGAVMFAPASLFFTQTNRGVSGNAPIEDENANQTLARVTYEKHPDWSEVVITHAFFPSTSQQKVDLLPFLSQSDNYTYKVTAEVAVINWVPASHPVKTPITIIPLDMSHHDGIGNKMRQITSQPV